MQNNLPIQKILGAMGRNGDNMIAHMRRGGEMVVPLDAPEAFGDTLATFAKEIANYNKKKAKENETRKKQAAETLEKYEPEPMLDIRDFIAGWSNPQRTNPHTGAEEYFSIAGDGAGQAQSSPSRKSPLALSFMGDTPAGRWFQLG